MKRTKVHNNQASQRQPHLDDDIVRHTDKATTKISRDPRDVDARGADTRTHWPVPRASYFSEKGMSNTAANFVVMFAIVWCAMLVWDGKSGIRVDTTLLWSSLHDLPVVLVINVLFAVYTASVYLLVKTVALGYASFGTAAYTAYSFVQAGVLLLPIALLFYLRPNFSPIAGACVIMQCAVYSMKIHSFFFTHRHIYEFLLGLTKFDRDIGPKESFTKRGLVYNPKAKPEHQKSLFYNIVSVKHFVKFMIYPTLCYYIEYPINKRTNWQHAALYFTEMVASFALAYITIVQALLPIWSSIDNSNVVFLIIKAILPGFITFMSMAFGLFHACLNLLAEIHGYEDRRFYEAWWTARSMQVWWSEWNTLVADWMRRHVYWQSMQDAGFTQRIAMLSVFVVSALWHELVLVVALRCFRPLLLVMIVGQITLIRLTNLPSFRDTTLGNFIVLLGVFFGYPFVATLYAWLCKGCCKY
ncbi:membrane bound O-acyl transferase family protein [Pelomyxa schiedti]|nr:membrane bound O-acyl transferase family protein [Pelomyxa schiedti]